MIRDGEHEEVPSTDLVPGDVTDSVQRLSEGMAGCTHVVHGAALVYAGADWSSIRGVNVDATRSVLTAAARAGVEHALHVSSVAVYGTVDGDVSEDAPVDTPLPADDLYARSKRLAEIEARAVEAEHGLPVAIVRPSAVYGEHDRLLIPALTDILRRRVVPVFGPGDNTLPVVYAGNVATAMLRMLEEAGGSSEATYDVGLDHPLTQRALFQGLADGSGLAPRLVTVPAGVVRAGVSVLSRLGVRTPGARHLPLERVARLALGENPYPSRRVRERLGWAPEHRHEEALARSGRWYANRN